MLLKSWLFEFKTKRFFESKTIFLNILKRSFASRHSLGKAKFVILLYHFRKSVRNVIWQIGRLIWTVASQRKHFRLIGSARECLKSWRDLKSGAITIAIWARAIRKTYNARLRSHVTQKSQNRADLAKTHKIDVVTCC